MNATEIALLCLLILLIMIASMEIYDRIFLSKKRGCESFTDDQAKFAKSNKDLFNDKDGYSKIRSMANIDPVDYYDLKKAL
jgi:hypothetical protein